MHEMMRKWGGLGVFVVTTVLMTTQLLMHTALSSLPHRGRLAQGNEELQTKVSRDQRQQRLYDRMPKPESGKSTRSMRKVFEETHNPNDLQRIQRVVENLRVPRPLTPNLTAYDILHCPADGPPHEYPYHWPLRRILTEWNPDNPYIPTQIYQSLCVFDWDNDYETILKYRKAEVPFVVQNQPDLMKTSERWMSGQTHLQNGNKHDTGSNPGVGDEDSHTSSYLEELVGDDPKRSEYSDSNHFMFWRQPQRRALRPMNWQPPTQIVELTYRQWYQHATKKAILATETELNQDALRDEYYYFRLDAKGNHQHEYLFDELPMFRTDQQDAANRNNIFIVEPDESRGINCRFAMRGLVSEAHFDDERNWIVLMGGQRRYVLSHPRECPHLHLYPYTHPSGRQSSINWATDLTKNSTILQHAQGTEVILQASDAMYLPSHYFHFIVSLDISYQCNARSGASHENDKYISGCGL